MVNAWGKEARTIVMVSSIHNQRIERHNRAVNEQVFIGFKQEFYDLEREGILDPLNEPDMFCLQYIYLPRINRSLTEFTDAHNNHAVSTERNNFPAQLFWLNLHLTAFRGGRSSDDAWLGMNVRDWMSSQTLPHVEVPGTSNPLSNESYIRLQRIVEPLSLPSGKDLYHCAVQMVGEMMQQQGSSE